MNMEKFIKSISFPNTVEDDKKTTLTAELGKIEINRIEKLGEMAQIGWFEVKLLDKNVVFEIKESVCDITYTIIETPY